MIKLLLGRLLPAGLAAGLLTSAISPLQPALRAFGVAADALAGDANAGGVDLPEPGDLSIPTPGSVPNPEGFLAKLFGKKTAKTDNARREIAGLVDQLKAKADQRAAENTAKMGKKSKKPEKAKKAEKKPDAPKPVEPETPGTPPKESDEGRSP